MNRRQFLLTTTAVLACAASVALPSLAQVGGALDLKEGDTVVFLGDSITQQRLYTTYVEGYLLSRYPKKRLKFRNSGWGGDTAWLRQRTQGTDMSQAKLSSLQGSEQEKEIVRMVAHGLRRDVLPLKPDVVTIDFGMNDARGGDAVLPIYRRATGELISQLRLANVRPVLLTPSPEERSQEGQPAGSAYNLMLSKYSAAVREIAARDKVPFADQFQPYVELVDRARKTDPAFKTMPDGVHPFPSGHLVMAWGILKGLGADPIVSEVSIDVARRPTQKAERARVRDLRYRDGVLTFTREDDALPMPLPKEAGVVLPYAPILDDLSRYTLTVTGLKDGSYDILVDGQKAASATSAQLAQGWNMTTAATPMTAQASALMQKVVEKNDVFFARWRQVLVPAIVASKAEDPDVLTKLDEADKKIAALEVEIEALRKPKPHQFEIRPAG